MHILIVHMRYAPDPTGTGPLVTELARGLVERGDEVTVICSAPHYGRGDVPDRYKWRLARRELDHGVRLWRTAAFPWWGARRLGRAIDYGLYALLAGFIGLGLRKPDAVLAIAPPITVAPVAWLVSWVKKAPLVYNAQDIWPDGLVQMGRLGPGPLLALLRRMERWVYSIADTVMVVSRGMQHNLEDKGVPASKIVVQPNWVDTKEIRPADGGSFRREHGLEGKFVVLFAGNHGYAAGLEVALDAAQLLRDEDDICLLLVGEGSAKAELVARAQQEGLDTVQFVTTQPRARLSEMLAAADLGLVTLRGGMGSLSVPSKTYAYMAAGLPLLAAVPEDSEIRALLDEAGCGRWVPAEAPAALAEAIVELRDVQEGLAAQGAHGRAYAVEHFSRRRAIDRYRELLHAGVEVGS